MTTFLCTTGTKKTCQIADNTVITMQEQLLVSCPHMSFYRYQFLTNCDLLLAVLGSMSTSLSVA